MTHCHKEKRLIPLLISFWSLFQVFQCLDRHIWLCISSFLGFLVMKNQSRYHHKLRNDWIFWWNRNCKVFKVILAVPIVRTTPQYEILTSFANHLPQYMLLPPGTALRMTKTHQLGHCNLWSRPDNSPTHELLYLLMVMFRKQWGQSAQPKRVAALVITIADLARLLLIFSSSLSLNLSRLRTPSPRDLSPWLTLNGRLPARKITRFGALLATAVISSVIMVKHHVMRISLGAAESRPMTFSRCTWCVSCVSRICRVLKCISRCISHHSSPLSARRLDPTPPMSLFYSLLHSKPFRYDVWHDQVDIIQSFVTAPSIESLK